MRIDPKGYRILESLHAGPAALVVRAVRERDQRPVLLQILERAMATPAAIARCRHEYEILDSLRMPGVIQVLGMETVGGLPMLVLEDMGANTLAALLRAQRPGLDRMLALALRVVTILGEIHERGVIHGDVNPSHILYNADTGEVALAGFGSSVRVADEALPAERAEDRDDALGGTLAYMSPEQTGRMNRPVDYRTDFYSLGVTLYELCTGRLPFVTEDALELVHSHLARKPVPPHEVDAGVPVAVSDIVLKLMAKMPEARYQSARGCARDLEECRRQLDAHGAIERFALGRDDQPERFSIPARLYGREQELATLRRALRRTLAGARQMVLVSGHPGVGKSALVRELRAAMAGGRGYFLEGKYEQYHRNTPYSALAQAFGVLVQRLLTEPENRVEEWRRALCGALGAGAGVLVEVIPELVFLLGPQPAVPELGPIEAENRLSHAFQRFLDVLCTSEHPLVVFLDDLQWADAASLRLMKLMATDPEIDHLLIIGAYRDTEVDAAHPLTTTESEVRAAGMDIERVALGPLGLEHIGQLLADTLQRRAEDCAGLAELVLAKTEGNPLFMSQFLGTLDHDRLLTFDRALGGWRWDIEAIRGLGVTDSVVELMVERLRSLPEPTRHVLELAACVGHMFDMAALVIVGEDTPEAIRGHLAPALAMGLIQKRPGPAMVPDTGEGAVALAGEWYGFAHDRIQQAAYALASGGDKAAVHLRIGRRLEAMLSAEERERRLFALAEHFMLGARLIHTPEERLLAARLCLAAGRRAKQAMAYESARGFLRAGLSFMPAGSWREHDELMRDLAMATVEAEYLNADVDAARRLSRDIEDNVRDVLDMVAVHDFQIVFHIARNQMHEATELALATVAMLGVELPREPAARAAREQALRAQLELTEAGFAALEHLPELTDRMAAAVVHILNRASTAALFTDPPLWKLIVLTMAARCMQDGHWSLAAMAYIQCGALFSSEYQDFECGSRFGALALRVIERFPDTGIEVKVIETFHYFVAPWTQPVARSVAPYRSLILRGLQTGDLEFGLYGAIVCTFYRWFISDPLEDVHREQLVHLAIIDRYRMVYHGWSLRIWERLTRALLGQPGSAEEPAMPETPSLLLNEWCSRAVLSYIMGDDSAALAAAEQAESYAATGVGALISAEHNCFYSLASLAALPDRAADPERARDDMLARVERNQILLGRWAERVPENFAARHALVEAERARVRGEVVAAMDRYDEAMAAARAHGSLREEALACERAAGFYAGLGRERVADLYLYDAYLAYRRWGAHAKVCRLEEQQPWLAHGQAGAGVPATRSAQPNLTSSSGATRMFDLESVVRASQALSSQLVLDQLLAELMKLIIVNAGAQRGYLLLAGADRGAGVLTLEAEGDIDTGTFRALPSLALDEHARLARTAVSYVSRTGTSLVLGHAADVEPHAQDPYVRACQPRSLLCAPVARHGALVGIIYLENNRAADAFTPGRVEVVQMLATQAAISIENARLLGNLERAREEAERAREEAERAREEAERASRAKSEFLANINHELRTPMNGIIGTIELLQGTQVSPEQRDYLAVAHTAAEHLMRIIHDTLDVSRIEAGKFELEPIRFSLDECLTALVRMLSLRPGAPPDAPEAGAATQLESRGLSFSLDVAEDVPRHLFGDRDRLLQVLVNLLGNAIKFTPRGGAISLHVAVESREADAATLRFEVRDTGIGIAADAQHTIFQPFSQVHTLGLGQGGSGLGLAIASSLVALMHGRIGVESALGEGSRFWFTIRLGVWQPEAAAAVPLVEMVSPPAGLRILVAEDNRVNQLVAVRLLNREGHHCAVAENGAEALRVLESEPIDAVLMDVHMPVMDGYAAAREIRRREQGSGRHVPIIAISASATTDVVAACTAAGMDRYLSKPLRMDAVREVLRDVVPAERPAAEDVRT